MADILSRKYAPRTFDEIVARQTLLAPLEAYIKKNHSIRNLLFEGFQGGGKTTTAFVIRNILYGNEWRGRFFEINASKENGVDFIREKVNEWATLALRPMSNGKVVHTTIFMDEADHLTSQAQAALRRPIEDYESTCRFIFACNYKEKLLPAILSRCTKYHFDPLPEKATFLYLKWVAQEEGINPPDLDKQLAMIIKIAKGDMRDALNYLEELQYGKTYTSFNSNVLKMSIQDMFKASLVEDVDLLFQKLHEELIELSKTKDTSEAFIILAEHEYYSAVSRLKSLQLQTAHMKIKKALGIK